MASVAQLPVPVDAHPPRCQRVPVGSHVAAHVLVNRLGHRAEASLWAPTLGFASLLPAYACLAWTMR